MFELDYDTKYLCVVLEFDYDSKTKKSKFTPNDIREAFLGISPPEYPYGRGNPNIPSEIKKFFGYDREIIYPVHFSLIKKPVKVEIEDKNTGKKKNYTIRNSAVGAIILYKYLGLLEDYESCCKAIEKLIKDKKNAGKPAHIANIKDLKIIIGFDYKDVSE